MTDRVRCDYHSGMFADAPRGPEGPFDIVWEFQAASFHEAGHAVVGYALGLGCVSAKVWIKCLGRIEGKLVYQFPGVANAAKATLRRFEKKARLGSASHALVLGIHICAGPAAGRRFRVETKLPLSMRGGTCGDHHQLDNGFAKALGDRRFAYLRASWSKAQKAIDCEAIWSAIMEVAATITDAAEFPEKRDVIPCEMPGRALRAIARRHGIRPKAGAL